MASSASSLPTPTADLDAPTLHPPARLHHLDALRAGALLLGVVLHTVLGFVPGVPWLFEDSSKTTWALPTMLVIHLFRMILFMMLAGYFGRMVLHRREVGAYVRDRLLRIGLPLVAFWPFAVLALPVVIVIGAALRGDAAPVAPAATAAGTTPGLLEALTPGQLWFLLLLLEIILVVVALRALLLRVLGADRARELGVRIGRVLSSRAGLVLAAVPYALGLLVQGRELGGIQEPTTILPVAGASIAYGGAFVVGWFLQAAPGSLDRIAARWPWMLALAVLLTVLVMVTSGHGPGAGVVLVPLAGWSWVHALLGIAARVVRREIPAVRYLADASYWIYLLHLPMVVALGIAMADLPLPALVKVMANLVLTTGILLLAYDAVVRSTWIGRWLNGHRRPRVMLRRRRQPRRP